MIVLRFILADLKRMRLGVGIVIMLVALATSLGVAINLQERALRTGSARAADHFDLVIGAPGSETQLVLSSVFLQPYPLPLIQGQILKRLSQDSRVAWVAPLGFGDSFEGLAVVGTTAQFVTGDGKKPLQEGRIFQSPREAVIGAHVDLRIGSIIKPLHGLPGEGGRTHREIAYTAVGRMTETGTPWDKAILVPIESVWTIHGLEVRHENNVAHNEQENDNHSEEEQDEALQTKHLGPPWLGKTPGVPALIIKPKTFADAYKLRAEYRNESSLAVFPAEVLTRLYATLGDARYILSIIAIATQVLIAVAIIFISIIHVDQRRHQIASLRVFGASRIGIFIVVWTELMLAIGTGLVFGLALGYLACRMMTSIAIGKSGIFMPVVLQFEDVLFVVVLLVGAAIFASLPAWFACKKPPVIGLRS